MINFSDKLFLAPLAGITDRTFRRIARRFGADITLCEMANCEAVTRGVKKTDELLAFSPDEHPIGAQLFGKNPASFRRAAKRLERMGFDFIDINAGCPARKVTSGGAGAALLRTPQLLMDILSEICSATSLPVTLKTRLGWDKPNLLELVEPLEKTGIAAITVHTRTAKQGFRGEARKNYHYIRQIKAALNIPVIANGDVFSLKDYNLLLTETGADSVMIARGALGNPWIFKEIKQGKKIFPSLQERASILLEHIDGLVNLHGERRGLLILRKFIIWYTKGLPSAKQFRAKLFEETKTLSDVREAIIDYFNATREYDRTEKSATC
ncbi:MAG: tRNA dihydrouridine synthase DusB [candidate division Zixibacteria bacterium 4484_93]|nr:MAG: tRNA dihydrouridine synthase DusB [candidate division Zixibacteria bacterium 4484_93]